MEERSLLDTRFVILTADLDLTTRGTDGPREPLEGENPGPGNRGSWYAEAGWTLSLGLGNIYVWDVERIGL